MRSFVVSRGETGGKLTIQGLPLYFIIARVYHVGFQSPRLSGGPEWKHHPRTPVILYTREGGTLPP